MAKAAAATLFGTFVFSQPPNMLPSTASDVVGPGSKAVVSGTGSTQVEAVSR